MPTDCFSKYSLVVQGVRKVEFLTKNRKMRWLSGERHGLRTIVSVQELSGCSRDSTTVVPAAVFVSVRDNGLEPRHYSTEHADLVGEVGEALTLLPLCSNHVERGLRGTAKI